MKAQNYIEELDVEKWNVGGKINFDFYSSKQFDRPYWKLVSDPNVIHKRKTVTVCRGKYHLQRAIKAALIWTEKNNTNF